MAATFPEKVFESTLKVQDVRQIIRMRTVDTGCCGGSSRKHGEPEVEPCLLAECVKVPRKCRM